MRKIITKLCAFLLTFSLTTAVFAMQNQQQNIVQKAVADQQLSTLVTALTTADLVDTLSSGGPYTVFAPTNEAFAQLPPGVLDDLLQNKAALVEVLTYHVVPGNIKSSDIKPGDVPTVAGQEISITVDSAGNVMINGDAKVVQADIMASNGVIHVINEVLIPPQS